MVKEQEDICHHKNKLSDPGAWTGLAYLSPALAPLGSFSYTPGCSLGAKDSAISQTLHPIPGYAQVQATLIFI